MKKKISYIIILFSIWCTGCATNTVHKSTGGQTHSSANHKPKESILNSKIPDELQETAAHEFFLRALHLKNQGQYKGSLLFMEKAFEYAPYSHGLAMEISNLYTYTGEYEKALQAAKTALDLAPDSSFSNLIQLARLYVKLEQPDSADFLFSRAFVINDSDVQGLFEHAQVQHELQKFKELSETYAKLLPHIQYPEQLVQKQLLLSLMNQDTTTLFKTLQGAWNTHQNMQYASALLESYKEYQKYPEALALCDEAAAILPEHANTFWLTKSDIYKSMQQLDSALHVMKHLVNTNPDSMQFIQILAMGYLALGEVPKAKEQLNAILQKDSNNVLAHSYLAQIAMLDSNITVAKFHLQRALTLNPGNVENHRQLALFFAEQRHWDSAFSVLDTALVQFPDNPYLMHTYARFYIAKAIYRQFSYPNPQDSLLFIEKKQNRLKAIALLHKCIAIDSTNSTYLFDLGSTYEQLNQIDTAITILESLINEHPKHHRALNYLGYTLVDREIDVAKGRILIDSALELDPENEAYLDSKAWYLFKMKKYEQAWDVISKISDENKDDHTIFEHKAFILEAMGRNGQARKYWEIVLSINPYHEYAKQIMSQPAL